MTLTFSSEAVVAGGVEFLRDRFPRVRDLKRHRRTVSCHVPDERVSVILGHVLANKRRIGLVEFGFKETSLDDVFIKFASEETTPTTAECTGPGGLALAPLGPVESAPVGEEGSYQSTL